MIDATCRSNSKEIVSFLRVSLFEQYRLDGSKSKNYPSFSSSFFENFTNTIQRYRLSNEKRKKVIIFLFQKTKSKGLYNTIIQKQERKKSINLEATLFTDAFHYKKKNSIPTQTKEQKRFTVNFSQKILERRKRKKKYNNPITKKISQRQFQNEKILRFHAYWNIHTHWKEKGETEIRYLKKRIKILYIQYPRRDSTGIVRFVALEYNNAESRGVQLMECGIHIPPLLLCNRGQVEEEGPAPHRSSFRFSFLHAVITTPVCP